MPHPRRPPVECLPFCEQPLSREHEDKKQVFKKEINIQKIKLQNQAMNLDYVDFKTCLQRKKKGEQSARIFNKKWLLLSI